MFTFNANPWLVIHRAILTPIAPIFSSPTQTPVRPGIRVPMMPNSAIVPASGKGPKWVAPVHGVGLLFSLVGGFGLLARLGIVTQWPTWVIAKLVIWIVLGGWLAVAKRKLLTPAVALVAMLAFGGLAAFFAVVKPGT